jgi:hypothetical protein
LRSEMTSPRRAHCQADRSGSLPVQRADHQGWRIRRRLDRVRVR